MSIKYYISRSLFKYYFNQNHLTGPVSIIICLQDGIALDSDGREAYFDLRFDEPVEITRQQYLHLRDMENALNSAIDLRNSNSDINDLVLQLGNLYKSECLSFLGNSSMDRYYLSGRDYICHDEDYDVALYGDHVLIHEHIDGHLVTFYNESGQKQSVSLIYFDEDIANGRVKAITVNQFQHLAMIQGRIKKLSPIVAAASPEFIDDYYCEASKSSLRELAKQIEQQIATLEEVYSQECAAVLDTEHEYKSEETNLFSSER